MPTPKQLEVLVRLNKGDFGVEHRTANAVGWKWASDGVPINSNIVRNLYRLKLVDQNYQQATLQITEAGQRAVTSGRA